MAEDVDVKFQPLLDDEEEADSYAFQPERKRAARGWLIAIVIILILALAGGGLYYWRQSQKVPVTYTTAAVTVGNLSTTISATGPISAHAVYALNFANAGQISEIDVKIGQHVTQGQVLAKLYINNNTSRVAELTAPQAATVAAINGVVGASSGSSTGGGGGGSTSSSSSSAFMTLIDISSLNITAQVNESDVANVKVGQAAQFTVASYPSATFRASVASIELIGQTSSSVVTFPVHLTVDQNSLSGNNLYPGMTATVNITTAQRIGALLVPSSAISFTSTALQAGEVDRSAITALTGGAAAQGTGTSSTSGSSRVVLTLTNGKLTPVLIKTGLNSGQYVEVLSGLQEGAQVVVSQTGGATTTTTTTRTGTGGFGGGAGGFGGGAGGFGGGGGGGRTGSGG